MKDLPCHFLELSKNTIRSASLQRGKTGREILNITRKLIILGTDSSLPIIGLSKTRNSSDSYVSSSNSKRLRYVTEYKQTGFLIFQCHFEERLAQQLVLWICFRTTWHYNTTNNIYFKWHCMVQLLSITSKKFLIIIPNEYSITNWALRKKSISTKTQFRSTTFWSFRSVAVQTKLFPWLRKLSKMKISTL